jgi:hypothetical protein
MPWKSAIPTFVAGLPQALDQGAEETAEQVKQTRDPLTPVDSGDLLASGRVVQVAQGFWQFREGDGLPDARSSYTEYGTAKQAAQPHVTPAAEQNRAGFAANVARHLKALERQSKV